MVRSLAALLATVFISLTFARAGINSFSASPTVFLPGQEVTLTWNVSVGDSISISPGVGSVSGATGSVKVEPTVETTYTLTNSTSGTTAQVTVRPFTGGGLIHRWSFNEASGTTVTDSVGGAHGTILGTGFSRSGGQVNLPGGSSSSAAYIDLPNGLISGLEDATFEGWMTVTGNQTWSRIFDFGTGTAGEITGPGNPGASGTTYIVLAQNGSNLNLKRLSMRLDNTEILADLGDPSTLGQQFHFAVVYDADGNGGNPVLHYYKNGVLVGSNLNLTSNYRLSNIVDNNNWLGRSNFTGDSNTQGSYNEFRIWSSALSQQEITANIAAGPNALPAAAPKIDAFAALPPSAVFEGTTVRLSYVFSKSGGSVTGSIDQGIGALTGTSGYVEVTPSQTTTYKLTVTDGTTTREAEVTVQVIPSAPKAENLNATANYETATPITLIATDPNTPLNQLQYIIVNPPIFGTISAGTSANRTYTPNSGYSGPDFFTYKVSDGTLESEPATVNITVYPAPNGPSDLDLTRSVVYSDYTSGSYAGRLQAVDPNPNDTFTFELVSGDGDTHNSLFSIIGNQLISQHDFSGNLNETISIRVRVTDSTGNSFDKVITRQVQAPTRNIIINEIHYNSARNTQLSEFIELYNPLDTDVDISNWRFTDGISYTFPPDTIIPANGYIVVAQDPPTIEAIYGVNALGPWTGSLSGSGEEIVLRNHLAQVVDRVDYGVTAPWPVPPDGDGPTLELINPALDNDLGGHWRPSTNGPASVSYINAGSNGWRFFRGISEASSPIDAWRQPEFADTGWNTGTAPIGLFKLNSNSASSTHGESGVTLGTQLTDMATYSGGNFSVAYRSVFFRKTFNATAPIPRTLLLRVMHNDAAIVWINGVEVVRFGFPPNSPTNPPYNHTAYYERGNDPWSEILLTNVQALIQPGQNVLAIQGFAKPPQLRSAQDDPGLYNIFDFCIDAELKSTPEVSGTPGAQNSVFSTTAPPAVHQIHHAPLAPRSWEPVTVIAEVDDPQGVGNVVLSYQVVSPGNYIPATLPLTRDQILANPRQPVPNNPAFESPANWFNVTMKDDGSVPGDIAGDGIFTAQIPARPHRTLIRYRITATDLAGASVRVPALDDPRRNFAYYVYDGVPTYNANGQFFTPSQLTSIPVYQWITRSSDYSNLLAYSGGDQFPNNSNLNVLEARRFYNVKGTLVVGGQVLDHTEIRLRGGNSRYMGNGKRHFRFKFPKGTALNATDENGRPYPEPWEDMLFNKLFGNKGYYDWGLTYEVGGHLWRLSGIPVPESHWVHFRVVRGTNEAPNATDGDFWGLYQALELPDGKGFLDARKLPRGNFYKMSDFIQNGEMDERYQAPNAVDFAEDFDNIRYNIHPTTSQSDIERYVNMPLWYRYNAVAEAIRHYDLFVEPTGRHRVKNLIWYFHPKEGTNGLGQCWFMPYDWDASFGPTFNSGWEFVYNAIYGGISIPDSPTWSPPAPDRTAMKIDHRNAIRELRDLIWYRDGSGRGPVDDIIDDAVSKLSQFWQADRARWPQTGAAGDHPNGPLFKAQDMKNFAFVGWTDAFGDPPVGAGGRAAFLDSLSDAIDAGQLPNRPTITYGGAEGFPVDGIVLHSSNFSDPQGPATFGAMEWRIGEITDPTAPAYDPTAPRIYEAVPVWESGTLTTFAANIAVPPTILRVGHTYRARVRHRDTSGRWSHWSEPLQFTASASDYAQVLRENLMITEFMYHPSNPTPEEALAGFLEGDFEYIELRNVSDVLTLDLSAARFTKGIDFDFAGSAITSLPPGAFVLVVKNIAAFNMRYGPGKPIAGQWDSSDNLSNSGEELKLSFGAGATIHSLEYDDAAPWPEKADEGGYSLVLINPESRPNHADPANWRASHVFGGTPGEKDTLSLADWLAENGETDPLADNDHDGYTNAATYAFGHDLRRHEMTSSVQDEPGNLRYFEFTYTRRIGVEGVFFIHEASTDLSSWDANPSSFSIREIVDNGDGTERVRVRWLVPVDQDGRAFGRVRAQIP